MGLDPRELGQLNHRMDAALKGHPYVKSGIDIACWDILGKATGLPVCMLMGGRSAAACNSIGRSRSSHRRKWPRVLPPIAARLHAIPAQSRRRSRYRYPANSRCPPVLKATTGWWQMPTRAGLSMRRSEWCAVRDLDVYIEQPCLTYEECLAVRRSTDHPFVLDENIDGLDMLLRAR